MCLAHLIVHLRRRGFVLLDTQFWNAHMGVLHVQMDVAPAPAMSAMFQRFTVEHRVNVMEAPAEAEASSLVPFSGRSDRADRLVVVSKRVLHQHRG